MLIHQSNPKIVYLGTSSGLLYKSADGGFSWHPIRPGAAHRGLVIDTLVQHPTESDHIYAGAWDLCSAGGALFESRDGGGMWQEIFLPRGSPAIRDMAICAAKPDHMVVATLDEAYLSQDGGKTWYSIRTAPSELQKIKSVAIDPGDPSLIYLGTWRLPYRSTDAGKTWQRIQAGMLLDSDVFSISPDARNPGVVYASACTGIYRSADRGLTWTRLKMLPDRFGVRAQLVSIDPRDSSCLYGGTTEGLFISGNSGQSWRRISPATLTINALQVDPTDTRRIFIGTDSQGVLRSEDGGKTWVASNSGFVHRQATKIIPNSQAPGRFTVNLPAEGNASGFMEYDRNEDRWSGLSSSFPRGIKIQSFLPLPRGRGRLIGTAKGIYRQPDMLGPWVKLAGAIGNLTVYDLVSDPRTSEILAGTSNGIYHSKSDLLVFEKPPRTMLSPAVFSIRVSPRNTDHIYGCSSLGVIRSFDRGLTWSVASHGMPSKTRVESLALSPAEAGHIFAGTDLGLFESKDAGNSWQRASDGRLTVDVPSVIFLDNCGEKIMAADNSLGGLFISLDGGRRWNKMAIDGLDTPVHWIAQDPGQPADIYIATNSEGVYRLRFDCLMESGPKYSIAGDRQCAPFSPSVLDRR